MKKQVFINIPVKDLEKSKAFFAQLGYTFNPQFTDENAACMIVEDNIFVMLIVEKYFKTFIAEKSISDAKKQTEVLIALSAESREAVDTLVDKALAAGGTNYRPVDDHGWMYSRSFADLDGHCWEVLHADLSKFPSS